MKNRLNSVTNAQLWAFIHTNTIAFVSLVAVIAIGLNQAGVLAGPMWFAIHAMTAVTLVGAVSGMAYANFRLGSELAEATSAARSVKLQSALHGTFRLDRAPEVNNPVDLARQDFIG